MRYHEIYRRSNTILGGDAMKIERSERRFYFHDIGLEIRRRREERKRESNLDIPPEEL